MKKAAAWTLGIVLFLCALPFVLWGLSIATGAIASLFYERYSRSYAALWTALMLGTIYGAHIGAVVWQIVRDRRNGALQAEIAAKAAMAERNPLSGLLRENATHWHVVLAVVRFGIVAALIVESLSVYHAHHWDHPKDLLTAWTPLLLLVVAMAFLFDWSWAIIKALPVAIGAGAAVLAADRAATLVTAHEVSRRYFGALFLLVGPSVGPDVASSFASVSHYNGLAHVRHRFGHAVPRQNGREIGANVKGKYGRWWVPRAA